MKSKIKPMTPGVPHSARVRAYLAGAVVTLGLCGVAWRAYALQVDDADHYRELADRQHELNVSIPAPRGDVIDAVGRPLAVSADVDSIWANPRAIHDVTDTADKLAKLIGGDAGALESKLGGDRKFVWIDRQVPHEFAAAVRAAKLPGIEVAKEPRRWYPGKSIGGPVIGRADIDSRGIEGIELSMNDVLVGSHGEGQAVRDARGKRMFADGLAQPEPGATVRLSLDRSIQSIADQALAAAVITNKAKNGVVVVLEVGTGRVLAMSSYPTYDPNSNENHTASRNRPVTDAYEAGSLMKVFTAAAAIDDGTVTAETNFDTGNGSFVIGPKRITDVHPYPSLTVSEIVKHSSNVGAAKIALRLGRDKLYAFLKLAGFGARTGIELPGESIGMLRKGATWRDIELATIAYGYGLTVTPTQIAAALAAIGSDGVYHPPRVIERITDPDGTVLYQPLDESRQIIKPSTAASMRKILATVFEGGKEGGTAKDIVVPGFRCGGKTGTAYKYDRETKHYATDRYMSSFAGLAPIDHPRIAIVVMVDEPSAGTHFGSTVAGPVFATVASETLRYLGVPGLSLVCPPPPPGYNPYLDTAVKTCVQQTPVPKPVVPKAVVVEAPPPIMDVPEPEPAPVPNGIAIPDFRGMGVARALDLARQAHLPVDVSGSGRVIAQDPMPGSVATPVRISLTFSDGAATR
ncbi:penicillin-binding protein [soil metagenome]